MQYMEHAVMCYQTCYSTCYATLLTFSPIIVQSLQTYVLKHLHRGQKWALWTK